MLMSCPASAARLLLWQCHCYVAGKQVVPNNRDLGLLVTFYFLGLTKGSSVFFFFLRLLKQVLVKELFLHLRFVSFLSFFPYILCVPGSKSQPLWRPFGDANHSIA